MFDIETYCIENEVWKDIPGYEDIYQASDLGRIRTVDGKITHSTRHGVRRWRGRILKNKTKVVNKQMGYRVSLWKNKQHKDWLVSRLVCLTFHGIPKNFLLNKTRDRITVNHIDGNRLNNKPENLEWLTLKENIRHAFRTGLMTTNHKVALIDKETNEYKEFNSKVKAGAFLGRGHSYIHDCLKNNKKITNTAGKEYMLKLVLKE